VVSAGALVLAGCSSSKSSNGGGETSEIQSGTQVTVAENSSVTTLNPFTATGYATYNSNVQYMTGTGWNYYDATPKLVKNTAFGTYKEISTNPLTIQYTLSKNAKWSDGVPVTAADMYLAYASDISKYNNAKGVNFGGINAGSGLDLITQLPKVSNGGRTFTTVFDKPYVDWEVSLITPVIPAHILWQEAFPGQKMSNTKAAAAVQTAITSNDTAKLTTLAKTWNTAWNVTRLPSD
jgi:peptide/nickel transport system substrate-binding protein